MAVSQRISVSVPSRGLSYLNIRAAGAIERKCFRPLTGTLLSKPYLANVLCEPNDIGFRPLTGTLLSKHDFGVF